MINSDIEYCGVIYLIKNDVNNKIYVGQTSSKNGFDGRYCYKGDGIERVYKRLMYCKDNNMSFNSHLLRSIQKYGFESFSIDKYFDTASSREELNDKEVYWINHFDSVNNGYNISNGGSGVPISGEKHHMYGKEHSEETKQKISNSLKGCNNHFYGKHHSDESKKKMSLTHKGKVLSKEQKAYLSEIFKGENHPLYGKHHSDESKKKMSDAKKGGKAKQSKKAICLTTLEVFDCCSDADEKYNLSKGCVGKVCRGVGRTAGKFEGKSLRWMFYEDYINLQNTQMEVI